MTRPTFFEMRPEVEAFDAAVTLVIAELKREDAGRMISEENIQRFSHGRRWNRRTDRESRPSEMQTISAGWETPFQAVVDGDLTLIPTAIEAISTQMHGQQMRMLYQTVSEVCDETGNTVSVTDSGSNAAAFLDMFRKLELSVGRDGEVSMPQIHAAPETARAMLADLQAQPSEYGEEIERLKAEKIAQAHERERARLARFRSGAPD